MNKNTARLLKIAKNKNNGKLAVWIALQANAESGNQVYLPNAYELVSDMMNNNQFAGYLSALAQEGCYKPQGDGFFGTLI